MGVWIVWSTAVGDWRELMARNHRGKEPKNHAPSQDRRQPKRERYLVGESCTKLALFQRNPGWWNKNTPARCNRFGCFAFQPAPTMVLPISPVLREVVARCYKMMDESYWFDVHIMSIEQQRSNPVHYKSNTKIHNEPLHKMRDYKSWSNLRVCIFKNLLIQFFALRTVAWIGVHSFDIALCEG